MQKTNLKRGDFVNLKNENKLGLIMNVNKSKYHLRFIDATEKTVDLNELKVN